MVMTHWRSGRITVGLVGILLMMISVVAVAPTASASTNLLTQTNLIDGTEIGVWETDGGPALTNGTVTSAVTATKTPMIRWGTYDCFTDARCGSDNHVGSLSKATFQTTISGIVNTLHAVPWLKLVPMTSGALGSVSNGTVFCPTASNWGLNLAMYKAELAAVSAVYKGPIIVESSNEAEYDCAGFWGFSSAGSVGVSTNIAHMWSATMPALKAYALGLGFSQVVTVGYIGVNGGTEWGSTCTANAGSPYGYNCVTPTRWIDEFNTQVAADYAAAVTNKPYYIPDVESVHHYCHSADFATNPYTFDNNICYAFQREQITNFRTRVVAAWGSTIGNGIRFAVSEWQAGICDSLTTDCWSGWGQAGVPGAYDDTYLSMLAGNGVTTGSGTAYWGAVLFEIASNGTGPGPAYYNIVNPDGSTPDWYGNVKTDFLATQGTTACTISEDASTPAVVHSGFGAASVSTASFSPPAGSLLEVSVNALQSAAGGNTITVSDSKGDTYTPGPHVAGANAPNSAWFFQTYLPSVPGSMTVTANQAGTHLGTLQLEVRVVKNANQVQTGAAAGTYDSGATGATNQSHALTTTTKGSWVYVNIGNGDATTTLTAQTGTTNVNVWNDSASGDAGAMGRATTATGTPGSATLGWTSSNSAWFIWAAQEVLPASC